MRPAATRQIHWAGASKAAALRATLGSVGSGALALATGIG